MAQDSAARIELGRSPGGNSSCKCVKVILYLFGMVTITRRSLAKRKLLEAHMSEVLNLVKGWFCRQTLMP